MIGEAYHRSLDAMSRLVRSSQGDGSPTSPLQRPGNGSGWRAGLPVHPYLFTVRRRQMTPKPNCSAHDVSPPSRSDYGVLASHPQIRRLGGVGSIGGAASTELGLGVGLALSHSAADSAEELAENGGDASVGGSMNLGPASIGYEQSMCSDCQPTRTLLIGPKLAVLPGEIHTTVAKSIGSTWVGSSPVTPTVTIGPAQIVSPPPAPVEPVKDDMDILPKESI